MSTKNTSGGEPPIAPARPLESPLHGRGEALKLAAVVLALLAILLMPPQPGLSPEGQRVLSIVAAAVVLWATEVVPVALSSLLVIVLLMVMNVVKSPSEALVGFTSPIIFFLLGSLAMGAAIMRSGLAERLAAFAVARCRGSSRLLVAQLIAVLPPMAFVMPSAINRNAMLIPAYEQVFRSLRIGRGEPLARVVTLTLGLLNPFASSALMTGGLAPMTTSTLLGGFTWFRWFALMAVPYYILLTLGGVMVFLMYRPGRMVMGGRGEEDAETGGRGDGGTEGTQNHLSPQSSVPSPPSSPRRPFSREEKVTLVVISGTSLLWLTDFIHHWNAAVPAMMAAVVLMSPWAKLFTWSQFEKTAGWSTFFVLGASLSLTQALISTGAASWFAQTLLALPGHGSSPPALLALIVILVTTLVHLGIPNMPACIALLIPVVAAFARETGMSPVAAGLIVGIVVDAVVLYPVQTATNLLAYETGHFESTDVLKVGIGMLLLTIAVVLLVAIPWWGLLGLPFSA